MLLLFCLTLLSLSSSFIRVIAFCLRHPPPYHPAVPSLALLLLPPARRLPTPLTSDTMRADYLWEIPERGKSSNTPSPCPQILIRAPEALKAKATLDVLSTKREDGLPSDYTDPDADSIPITSILAVYANRSEWSRDTQAALKASTNHRKGLVARIMYLNALRNTKAPLINDRAERLHHANCEISLVRNLEQWILFCGKLPVVSANALTRATWCELLEDEYRKMEPEWVKFWDFQEPAHSRLWSAGSEYRDTPIEFSTILKAHCKKKDFLQRKILESRDVLPVVYAPEPEWLEMDWRIFRWTDNEGNRIMRPIFFTAGSNIRFTLGGMEAQEIEYEEGVDVESEEGVDTDSDQGNDAENSSDQGTEESSHELKYETGHIEEIEDTAEEKQANGSKE